MGRFSFYDRIPSQAIIGKGDRKSMIRLGVIGTGKIAGEFIAAARKSGYFEIQKGILIC